MDYQYYQQSGPQFTPQFNPKRSRNLETASLVTGILALSLFCCIYPPLICGALSIVFGLLSRGGETTMTSRAKAGVALGGVALGLFVVLLLFSTIYLSMCYGGFSNMIQTIYEQYMLYGDDTMSFYQSLMESMPELLLY